MEKITSTKILRRPNGFRYGMEKGHDFLLFPEKAVVNSFEYFSFSRLAFATEEETGLQGSYDIQSRVE
jgi:hypothetical protein